MSRRLTETDFENYIITSIPGIVVKKLNIEKMMTVTGDMYIITTGIKFWNNPSVDYIVIKTYVDSMLDADEVGDAVIQNLKNCLKKF